MAASKALGGKHLERLFTALRVTHREPLVLEIDPQVPPDALLIIHHENASPALAHGFLPAAGSPMTKRVPTPSFDSTDMVPP